VILNINSDAAVRHTNRLEKLHRSALPSAIRGTLNKAAFNVKQESMPRSASRAFIQRQPNFFKANSRVESAKGFDIKQMKSVVGFTSDGLKGSNNFAVRDLEQQERGGTIKGRSFIPTNKSRGGSNTSPVRPGNRLSAINKIVNSNSPQARGKNRHEKFVRSAIHAGVGGYVIGNFSKKILWRIDSITKKKVKVRGRYSNTKIKATAVYTFEQDRSVRVRETSFMREASLDSARKMDDWYIEEAERQIKKLAK
jgi:hypothetical protein